LQQPGALQTTADSLSSGVYQFELRVTDNDNAVAADTITVTVNIPPTVAAGPDQTITFPTNSSMLNGSATDEDGTITAVQWRKVSGPALYRIQNADQVKTIVDSLEPGVYLFELTATDDRSAPVSDTVSITVNRAANIAPTAFAGTDTLVTLPVSSVVVKGSGTDADGTITAYQWKQIAGPGGAIIATPNQAQTSVSALTAEAYYFELTVTDDRNGTGKDTVLVTVNAPPVANAGTDKTITLPTNSITLQGSGTDNDGTITAYRWTKLSGPTQGTITTPGAATTTVTGLVAGSYVFRLTVTDNRSATAADDVTVTVNNAPVATKTINVNMYGNTNAYANSAWNNWSLRSKAVTNVASVAFKYADGTASTVSAVLSNSSDIADNGSSYSGGMAPAQVLRYTSYYTGTRTLTLKGLSATKKYTIELYASRNASGSSNIFTVNGVSQTISTYRNFTTKAVFYNLIPNSAGQLVVTIAKTGTYNYLNGFSITENSSTSTVTTSTLFRGTRESEATAPGEAFEMYPNPATDRLVIKLTSAHTGSVTAQVVATTGRVVQQVQYVKAQPYSQYLLPLHELAAGIYVLRIQVGDWHTSVKFLKL
jgi:hypothetical protein